MRYAPYALTERLEERFGDPNEAGRAFSLARCADLDEREEFPAEICRELDEIGIPRYYVPARYGGAAHSYEDTLQVFRALARRDLTVAIAHGKTLLGAVSVWVGGDPVQAQRLADEVTAGRVVSWALTEEAHGSDLLANEVSATPTRAGYRLTGEKWLINNATRADIVCVLARTDPAGGPRGFSLLLVDKRQLPPGSYRCLAKVRTHGIRGSDTSGIAFTSARIPADAIVGEPGSGLEIVLKGFQITRTLCTGLSLGAADRALRLATGFAAGRRPCDRFLIDLPNARRTLAEAYADLLVAEAVSLVATRSIHALPGEQSITSAVAKYLVPTSVHHMIARLGEVLGARAVLRNTYAHGAFQKTDRDHRIVGIFDGSTLVNLNALINQFGFCARAYRRGLVDEAGLEAAADLAGPPPPFDPDRLALVAPHGCSMVQSLAAGTDELQALASRGDVPAALALQAKELREITDELHAQMAAHKPSAREVPAEAFETARRYALCFSAAACLRLWLANRSWRGGDAAEGSTGLWTDALWLAGCLTRVLQQLRPGTDGDDRVLDRLVPHLRAQYRDGQLFSMLPCRVLECAS